MAFNKFQIEAVKKIQEILKMEYFNPETLKKQIAELQVTLKNINSNFSKSFSGIKSEKDADSFVIKYLNKSLSKDTFEKIKDNYSKTKKIFLTSDLYTNLNKSSNSNQINQSPLEKMLSNITNDKNKSSKLKELNEKIDKLSKSEAKKLGEDLGKNFKDSFNKDPNKAMDMLGDMLSDFGLDGLGSLEDILNLSSQFVGLSDDEIDKKLDDMFLDMKKTNPELAKKLEEQGLVDKPKMSEAEKKAFEAGKNEVLRELNFPTIREINQSTESWSEERRKPEIQAKIKSGQTVKISKPYIKNINGNSIKISELNTNNFEVKDPKKCTLLFIDEDGKVHQINKLALEKGKWKIDPKKGLQKEKTKEK